ncbi:Bacillolysin [Dactylellina cionopaga]|nr:Bacillolysin [Dactylellina cionopaga]
MSEEEPPEKGAAIAPVLVTPESRVAYEASNKAIRLWYDLSGNQAAAKPFFNPRDVAYDALKTYSKQFAWNANLADLVDHRVNSNGSVHSVRFTQQFKEVPVDASEVVVNIDRKGTVYSIYNAYHYDIPQDLEPKKITVSQERARSLVNRLVQQQYKKYEVQYQALIVYQYYPFVNRPPRGKGGREGNPRIAALRKVGMQEPIEQSEFESPIGAAAKEGQYYLAWDFKVLTQNPRNYFRILLDAMTGQPLIVIDLAQYATGTAKVFDPNPVVTTGNASLAFTTPASTLDGYTQAVGLDHLNPKDSSGNYHLDGTFVEMDEIEAPTFNEPTSTTGDFSFSTANRAFLDAMVYFHIDRFQNYIETSLGLTNVANYNIRVDPQGYNGDDNSHYIGNAITFGEGGGVPDAQDAMVILHEYGHAIQDNTNPGFDNPPSGIGEGFGDFLSAVYYDDKHTNPSATRGWMMSWDARGGWGGRRYDVSYNFDDPQYTSLSDNHDTGQLWCTTGFEIYRKLGGDSSYIGNKNFARDLAIRLHLQANFNVPASKATTTQMAQQIEAADGSLGGWYGLADKLHQKVIYDTFRRRHLPGYPNKAVDVYINDGREGGYGSTSGNDLFTEKLWQESYWDTQDIWVKTTPYANAAAQAAGGPNDHVEPPVNSTAYLYARVKNRGTSGSGPVKVRAFHAEPSIGLSWPDDWFEMDASQVAQPSNITPGTGNGIIVGPFAWNPSEVGHECVFVIAECNNDRATTQVIAANAHVEHSQLVPFDNNIAQRNLHPTAAKGKFNRGFWVRNPDEITRSISLIYDSRLPRGWRFTTNLVNSTQIRLGPLDRRWVELVIDQAAGVEVTNFDKPLTLTVTGLIEDRVIGGMTYYIAPDSAFAQPTKPPGGGHGGHGGHCGCHSGDDNKFCFHISSCKEIVDCSEIEVKIRFDKK